MTETEFKCCGYCISRDICETDCGHRIACMSGAKIPDKCPLRCGKYIRDKHKPRPLKHGGKPFKN